MKFLDYLLDHIIEIFVYLFFCLLVFLLFSVFPTDIELKIAIFILFFFFGLFFLFFDFFRRKKFYDDLQNILNSLDQKYLISEMIQNPKFLEGRILFDVLYETDKSMNEHLSEYLSSITDFKEYVELWVHEIKVPISSGFLILHNYKNSSSKKIEQELSRIEDDVEQILYYVRSENVEKDYFIRPSSLKEIVGKVIRKNKNRILMNNISLDIDVSDTLVRTDAKWMEFILHQILNNSIQYAKKEDAKIHIYLEEKEQEVLLHIEDNGIGISKADIPRVFEKGFTGTNGRVLSTSTGMGLYLSKKLIEAMGHSIKIDSVLGEYTHITILFSESSYYNVVS